MAGLGGEVGRPSREDDEHLVIGSVKSQAADAARVGVGGGALGPLIRTGDPYSLRGSYVFPAQPGGHGLCPGLGSQPCLSINPNTHVYKASPNPTDILCLLVNIN